MPDNLAPLRFLVSMLILRVGFAHGRRERLRMHTVEVLMQVFSSSTFGENQCMASVMRRNVCRIRIRIRTRDRRTEFDNIGEENEVHSAFERFVRRHSTRREFVPVAAMP